MDGLAIDALCRELHALLEGARIDKIHQPAERDVVVTARSRGANHRLLLSANRAEPRVHLLYEGRPSNPEEPPMFCMMLRKRLEGGKILSVHPLGRDRIVNIVIENLNELGDVAAYAMVLEVMGKHSNLMVCEADAAGMPTRILDSIVHVSPDVSRVRPVLPGFQYTPVPLQAKRPVDALSPEDLVTLGLQGVTMEAGAKALTRTIAGIGPLTAREALHRAAQNAHGHDSDSASVNPSADEAANPVFEQAVVRELNGLVQEARHGSGTPSIQLDELGRPVAAAPFALTHTARFSQVESFNQALDALFQASVEIRQSSRLATQLIKYVTDTLDKLRGKRMKLSQQLSDSTQHETLRIKGELLTTYSRLVVKGSESVSLPNYYDEEHELDIALDPSLGPIENAQRYFKQSSKRKRSIPILTTEIASTVSDIDYLEGVLIHLMDAPPNHLEAIREELIRQGFYRSPEQRVAKAGGKSKQGSSSSRRRNVKGANPSFIPPDRFISTDGFPIRVGRNNRQNDTLTLKSSQPHDIWLHVKDQPGSHVVIQTDKKDVPDDTLREAALLAAYFSKGRDSANVAVDYARISQVWKPNGARPGHVLYEGQKTLYVTPERSSVQSVLSRRD